MSSRRPNKRPAREAQAPRVRASKPDNFYLIVGTLAVLLGLGIVIRGLLQHGETLYIASGVVFVAFGLWRLRQWITARGRTR